MKLVINVPKEAVMMAASYIKMEGEVDCTDLSDSDIRVTAHVVSNVFDNRPKISVNK